MTLYYLDDFKAISEQINEISLSQEVVDMINNLAQLVGAPTYVKTPNFKQNGNRSKKKSSDWGLLRNFKATIIEHKIEGIEKDMNVLREFLNKLTDKTYDENLKSIKEKINILEKDNLKDICKYIFEMASSNKFYSGIYAKLYKDLIKDFAIMKELCIKNFDSFLILFENIEYIDPDKDYDKFCDINEKNEKRRAMSQFFINLVKNKIINTERMTNLVLSLQEKLFENLKNKDKIKISEEIVENLYILLNNKLLEDDKNWTKIFKQIKQVINFEKTKLPGLTNKIKFKHMDLLET